MKVLSDYEIESEIHAGEKSVIYRAWTGSTPVIIKVLRKDEPNPGEVSAFKQEFEILQGLQSPGIIHAIDSGKLGNKLAIVFEDINGVTLTEAFAGPPVHPVSELIDTMIQISEALGEIHRKNLVHRDIKPQNILINRESGRVKIIDFGSASFLAKQSTAIPLNRSIDGTLAYMSPEQTGRMNRMVDYRTDMYSLGITFYQLLTGDLPFRYSDPLELVHAHIAKTPEPPFTKSGSPKPLSNITLKLMEKNPEDRYQSVQGLIHDLHICLTYLNTKDQDQLSNLDLRVGEGDRSSRFQIPEKLYGRSREIERIIETFKAVRKGSTELLLISGQSGIGKSALINEIQKPITEYRGYFTSGKYDKFKRDVPYRAITQGLQSLVSQILTEPQESVSVWKEKILNALGSNGNIITEVIPELHNLIGNQPDAPPLPAEEAQNRFNTVFQKFIQVFCTEDHPVAIFLDDMQWSDPSSVQLIKNLLLNSTIQHLCLILSFRDNEVYPSDPFALMIDDVKRAGFTPREIVLQPLVVEDVTQMVQDTLLCGTEPAREVAQVLCEKTNGNPFFVNEAFRSLYEKDLIYYTDNNWHFDIQSIKNIKISENVIEFMIDRVKELSENKRATLKLAACVGNWFRQDVFADIVSGGDIVTVKEELIQLANEGFFKLGEIDVYFEHDKIREAIYALTSDAERAANHYNIAKAYMSMLHKFKLEDNIFTIVTQLNQGINHVKSEFEIDQLRRLNTMAGNKSLASNAYAAARDFFQITIGALPQSPWENEYNLTLDLYTNKSKAEYLEKDYDAAETTFDLILKNARSAQDKIPVYELRSAMYVSQNKILEGLELLKSALKSLGLPLPRKPDKFSVMPELIRFKFYLGQKSIESLADLPMMKDENSLAIMRLLNASVAPAFLAQPDLFPVIVFNMVNLSIKKGNSPLSPFAYVSFGIIQGSGLGDFQAGYKFGRLALNLIGHLGMTAKSIECRTIFMFQTMINHWKRHAKRGKVFYERAYNAGLESGDLQYGSYSLNNIFFQGLMMRENLDHLAELFTARHPAIAALQQYNAYQLFQLNEQSVINCRGEAEDNVKLIGKYFDERKVLPEWTAAHNANALFDFYTSKSRLEYLFGDKRKAYDYALLAEPVEAAMFGMMFVPENLFFASLSAAAIYSDAKKGERRKLRRRIQKNCRRFEKWSKNCRANYSHKYHIIKGLLDQIKNNPEEALSNFKLAAGLAGKYGYLLEEAIAHELSAGVWEMRGENLYRHSHLVRAIHAYKKWGCNPKVSELTSRLPETIKSPGGREVDRKLAENDSTTPSIGSQRVGSYLDVLTVLKSSQAISSEIQLGKLLETMMTILLENAGAEKGSFILLQKDEWFVEAQRDANKGTIKIEQENPLEMASEIGVNIVNYVIRTKTIVLLDNASRSGMFVNDPYIRDARPKSLLCYPILHYGEVVAVVYLENNLTTNAFTPERIEVLKVLSSQIAISIENSLLYASLEENMQDTEFKASHDELTGLGNRRYFEERLDRAFEESHQGDARFILFYMDLDEFKIVNDTCGHTAGDELLRNVAEIFKKCLGPNDILFRLGGDEFGVLVDSRDIKEAWSLADSMQRALDDYRFHWHNRDFSVAVSVGIVAIDDHSESPGAILQAADTACYVAKEAGRSRIHIHSPNDPALAQRYGEMEWVSRIEHALRSDMFVLHGQPIVPLQQTENFMQHCEILLRMFDHGRKLVLPGDFIPAAERYHLSTKVDLWVIEHALQWLETRKNSPVECSINLSGRSLGDPDFLKDVIRILSSVDIQPSRICFEITETAAIGNMMAADKFILAMKNRGCLFALDDFGSGLASFAYLRSLPVDYLKIDGQFVKSIASDPLNLSIVKSIQEIASILGKQTIAEYVEDSIILATIKKLGIHHAQGYVVGKPVPLDDLFR